MENNKANTANILTAENLDEKYALEKEDLQMLFEEVPLNLFFKDTQGRYQLSSHICGMLSGENEDFTLRGKTDVEVQMDKVLGEKFYREDLEIVKSGEEKKYLQPMEFFGDTYYYEIHKKPVRNRKGEIIGIIGMVTDMTALIKAQQELKHLSYTDGLTGVYNRQRLKEKIHSISPADMPLGVIVIDCDGLKSINDTYGHLYGDQAILCLMNNVKNHLLARDEIYRVGGDEFVVLCPSYSEEDCTRLINEIRSTESEYTVKDKPVHASYGWSQLKSCDDSLEAAITEADKMMYQEKHGKHK